MLLHLVALSTNNTLYTEYLATVHMCSGVQWSGMWIWRIYGIISKQFVAFAWSKLSIYQSNYPTTNGLYLKYTKCLHMHSDINTKRSAAFISGALHVPCGIVTFFLKHTKHLGTRAQWHHNQAFTLSVLNVKLPVPCGTITKQFAASFFQVQ